MPTEIRQTARRGGQKRTPQPSRETDRVRSLTVSGVAIGMVRQSRLIMFRYFMIVLRVSCIGAKATHAYRHFHQPAQASTP
jgi:hypothetical protein